jgi:hypothetical protein
VEAARREPLVAAAIAVALSLALVALTPPTGDAPAHLYRTFLVEHGVFLWDNLWYGGHYPLASYSPLYYLPAALVGNVPLVFASCVAAAALFAAVARAEWGDAARIPSYVFALAACGPLFTGTYSYAVATATGLLALRAAQLGRTWLTALAAALTLALSPLAFLFLVLVLGAVAWSRRRIDVPLAVALAALAAAQVAVNLLFASGGEYPFRGVELLFVLTACAIGLALTRGDRLLSALFVLWALASVAAYAIPSPFGENVTRLRYVLLPLMLLAAAAVRWRPLPLAAAAVAAGLLYNVVPYATAAARHVGDEGAAETYWAPAIAFLRAHSTPDHRVEVVPTYDHWESYYVPRAGFALARGWYRQLDIERNPVLYEEPLRPERYVAWLRRAAVRYVLLPDTRLGAMVEQREAELLRAGALPEVARMPGFRVYEVPRATTIVEGGRVLALDHDELTLEVPRAGAYRLRAQPTPYYGACVERGVLRVPRAGTVTLRASLSRRSSC